jgi:anti-sigma B factor antagonist
MSQNADTKTPIPAPVPAGASLNIEQKLADKGAITLSLTGQIDASTFHSLAVAIKSLFQQKHYRLILDCSNVLYIASAGIGVIINAMSEAQANKGNVVILSPSPGALRTLLLFGLNEVVPVASDKAAASAYFA